MSLNFQFNTLLSSLSPTLNKKIIGIIYESMNELQKADGDYLSEFFCHNSGDFMTSSYTCQCDPGMFGLHCEKKGIHTWKGWYTFFQVLFGIIYGNLMLLFWINLILKLDTDIRIKRQPIRMFFTPKAIVHFNLVIISTSRFFYVVIDPFRQREIISHVHDMMVYYMIVAAFIAFYMQMFIVWTGITAVFNMGMGKISKKCFVCLYNKTKVIFLICMILIYPMQLMVNYYLAVRDNTNQENSALLYFGCFVFLALFITIIFLLVGMKKKIRKIYGEKNKREDINVKVKGEEEKNEIKGNKEEVIDFIIEMKKGGMLNLVNEYILAKKDEQNISDTEQLEYRLDYEKEIINLDQYNGKDVTVTNPLSTKPDYDMISESTKFKMNNTNIHIDNTIKSVTSMKKKKEKPDVNPLSKNDKKVIANIFNMSIAFIILTIFIIYLNIGVTSKLLSTISGTLVLYFITFFCEVAGMVIIYKLFFTNMSVQEYQNLKIIGEIEKYINPSGEVEDQPQIIFDDFSMSHVYGRFQSFVRKYTK